MNTQSNSSGYLLSLAGSAFWLSWFLMPETGTTESAAILNIMKQSRTSVFYSSLTQAMSSVLYITALFLLANNNGPRRKITLVGIILFGIGAMGMCVDAFFHLITYYMTDDSIVLENDIIKVMGFMQTDVIAYMLPMLLCFFLGSLLLSFGLNQQGIISKIPLFLNLTALVIIPLTGVISNATYLVEGNIISLSILGLVATSHAFLGSELIIAIPDIAEGEEVSNGQTEGVMTKP